MKKPLLLATLILMQFVLSGCDSKTKGYSQEEIDEIRQTTPYLKPTEENAKASQFLIRATFGPTREEITSLSRTGDYEKWIEEQVAMEPTYLLDWAHDNVKGYDGTPDLNTDTALWKEYEQTFRVMKKDAWWSVVANAKDQLRQRTAFALSEIFVISENTLQQYPAGRMHYYDGLLEHSFGNFRDILEFVTFHPMMARYLTYLYNKKADPIKGTTPDENYAREILQLFTIGLYQLNLDGTTKLDGNGKLIPTYYQTDIEELAKVFTGLNTYNSGGKTWEAMTTPLVAVESIHDTTDKIVMGYTIEGTDTKTEIRNFLDTLFNHPNVGPFIAKRLIQRFTTSNPTPEYIQEVAETFNDNGDGVRGDMKSVIKTVLLSKHVQNVDENTFGKLREPVLFVSHILRGFEASQGETKLNIEEGGNFVYNSFRMRDIEYLKQENSMEAPSVFNYFKPEDGPFELLNDNMVAPEFIAYTSEAHFFLMSLITKNWYHTQKGIRASLDTEMETLLTEYGLGEELINHLDILLTGGKMTQETKSEILTYFKSNQNLPSDELAKYLIGLVCTSPDFAIQQ